MERPNPPPTEKGSIGAAIALISLGLLAVLPSGLCTGILVVNGAWFALVIGGPFVAGGAALIWMGVRELRRR